jgi:transcriptional regulator with XRE-family HTH domain
MLHPHVFASVTPGHVTYRFPNVARLRGVSTQIGSGLRRRQLARILTELRNAAGVGQAAAAVAADCSRSQISHFERGAYVPSRLELPALLACYEALDRLPALEELRASANEPGWWSTYGLPQWLQAYVRLETDASHVRYFDLATVPGLLQTEGYARALMDRHKATPTDVKRRLGVLRERQRGVGGRLTLSVVVTEGLLDLTSHMGDMGADQLRYLADVVEPGVTEVRVLPTDVGMHGGMSGRFTLLGFPPGTEPPIAYLEHAVGGHLVEDQDVVGALSTEHDGLVAASLDLEHSGRVIRAYAAGYGQGGQVNAG